MAHPSAHFDSTDSALLKELRVAVDGYFESTGLSRHANAHMVFKSVLLVGTLAAVWCALALGWVGGGVGALLALLGGSLFAMIGFNVGHDAIHGAYSGRAWVNRVVSCSFDVIGASSHNWAHAHNVVHHTYTNITGVDHDLEPGPWMRFYPKQRVVYLHRFQHLYAVFLYGFTSLVWVFKKDYQQVTSLDPLTGKRPPKAELLRVVLWKVVHLGLFVVLPIALGHWAWWQVFLGYVMAQAAAGVTLATVFQLAHVVEQTLFVEPLDETVRPWAEHQLRTTANFAMGNPVARFLCGGLTHQIEHHLFSRVCHVHYQALSPLVREVARKHGLPYLENVTFRDALGSHFRQLASMGRPVPVVVATVVP